MNTQQQQQQQLHQEVAEPQKDAPPPLILDRETANLSEDAPSSVISHQETAEPKIEAPSSLILFLIASVYCLTGVATTLEIQWATESGLADMSIGTYMLFYSMGPSLFMLMLLCSNKKEEPTTRKRKKPRSYITWIKICSLAMLDLCAVNIFVTGATMAGATIFAIIYSSVTVWCALFSRILLGRKMSNLQWFSVFVVFGGLTVTGFSSISVGEQVSKGAMLVAIGTSLHALMYVLSEFILNKPKEKSKSITKRHPKPCTSYTSLEVHCNHQEASKQDNDDDEEEEVSSREFCAVFNLANLFVYAIWQVVYSRYHYDEKLWQPMQEANTSLLKAAIIFGSLMICSALHCMTFVDTLKRFWGGATSAGVMKGLQAVLVFVAAPWFFCDCNSDSSSSSQHHHTTELCFTMDKMISLVIVVFGVVLFGKATQLVVAKQEEEEEEEEEESRTLRSSPSSSSLSTEATETTPLMIV